MSDTQYISAKNKLNQYLEKKYFLPNKPDCDLFNAVDLLIITVDIYYEKTKSITRKSELIQILESTYTLIKNPNENNMAAYLKMADSEDHILQNKILATCMVIIPIILFAATVALAIMLNPLVVLAIPFVIAFPIAFFTTKYVARDHHSLIYEKMHDLSMKVNEQMYEKTKERHNSSLSFFCGDLKMESLDDSESVQLHPSNT